MIITACLTWFSGRLHLHLTNPPRPSCFVPRWPGSCRSQKGASLDETHGFPSWCRSTSSESVPLTCRLTPGPRSGSMDDPRSWSGIDRSSRHLGPAGPAGLAGALRASPKVAVNAPGAVRTKNGSDTIHWVPFVELLRFR